MDEIINQTEPAAPTSENDCGEAVHVSLSFGMALGEFFNFLESGGRYNDENAAYVTY